MVQASVLVPGGIDISAFKNINANIRSIFDTLDTVETTTPLAANATYTGAWVDTINTALGYVIAVAYSDAPGTLYIDFSDDLGATKQVAISISGSTATPTAPKVAVLFNQEVDIKTILLARFFRLRYVNGASPQSQFLLRRRLVMA